MRPLVLFLPALLLDQRSWDLVLPLLPPEPELERGFLDNPSATDPSVSASAALRAYETRLAERIAREDRGRRIVVAGNSLGAYIAARVVARTEGRDIACLALGGLARLPRDLVVVRNGAADQVERGDLAVGDVVTMLRDSAIAPEDRTDETARLMSVMLELLTRESLVWNLRLTAPLADDGWAVPPFTAPMTLLHGRADQTVPFACGEELAALGSATRLVPLDTSSHVLPLSHPALVASELKALLSA